MVANFVRVAVEQTSKGSEWWMLTLTMPSGLRTKPVALQVDLLRGAWRKMRARLRRQAGRTVAYLGVLEQHQDDAPHLHVMVDAKLTRNWLSEAWLACGGGYMVYVSPVKDRRKVAWYMAKQLRGPRYGLPRGVRRYVYGGGFNMTGIRPGRRTRV